jgi:hypothetical protein
MGAVGEVGQVTLTTGVMKAPCPTFTPLGLPVASQVITERYRRGMTMGMGLGTVITPVEGEVEEEEEEGRTAPKVSVRESIGRVLEKRSVEVVGRGATAVSAP